MSMLSCVRRAAVWRSIGVVVAADVGAIVSQVAVLVNVNRMQTGTQAIDRAFDDESVLRNLYQSKYAEYRLGAELDDRGAEVLSASVAVASDADLHASGLESSCNLDHRTRARYNHSLFCYIDCEFMFYTINELVSESVSQSVSGWLVD